MKMNETISDVFYIKTRDSTVFTIYDLTLSNDCDIISFGYNFLEDNPLDKSHYEEEVTKIVKGQVNLAIKEEIKKAQDLGELRGGQ
tara:strand:- start:297 stop:554 length:258 start_codon:yes stop_codon:yes gene_type:complete